MEINKIIINKRSRKDQGDIKALADSITNIGLLHPIVITPENELIAGERRLLAFRLLGLTDIPVTIANNFDDIKKLLIAERDENICRKDFTPSEAVELGRRLEPLERKAAKERQGERTDLQPSGKLPESSKGDTRDKVGEAVGMSGKTYEKAKAIVEAAEKDPETYGDLVNTMDNKGVSAAAKEKKNIDKQKELDDLAEKAKMIPDDDRYTLYLGDIIEQGANIPDASIDLILTDPPYPEEYLPEWSKLSELASRVLKLSGYLISYSGQTHLHEVMTRLSEHLSYYWIFTLLHAGGNQLIMGRNIQCGWKPLLVFQKPPFKKKEDTFSDIIKGTGREKGQHEWQQAVGELDGVIASFTLPGETILDPFAGSGTTLIASLKNNRQTIGIEIDEKRYNVARGRINEYLQNNH